MAEKKTKKVSVIEVDLIGGPLDKKRISLVNPPPPYITMDMGRALYVKRSDTSFEYTEDWSQREPYMKRALF